METKIEYIGTNCKTKIKYLKRESIEKFLRANILVYISYDLTSAGCHRTTDGDQLTHTAEAKKRVFCLENQWNSDQETRWTKIERTFPSLFGYGRQSKGPDPSASSRWSSLEDDYEIQFRAFQFLYRTESAKCLRCIEILFSCSWKLFCFSYRWA